MIKHLNALEIESGNRIYKLICEVDSPLGDLHDVLYKMKGLIIKIMNDNHASEQPVEPQSEDSPKEE